MATGCKGTNAEGEPCAAYVYPGDEWCRWHDPARADERRAWAVKGGRNKSTAARLKRLWESDQLTPAQLSGLLSAALVATFRSELDPGVMGALSGGARALIAVQQAAELEARLSALEDAVARDRGRIA